MMRFKTVAAWISGLLLASSTHALAVTYVTVIDADLRVRPGWESPPYGLAPANAPIYVDRCVGAWCRVRAGGYPGYVPRALINFGAASD
jgi:SH3-like domain-containing protein